MGNPFRHDRHGLRKVKGLITAAAVAALLGISRSKVYELARGGRLPAYRFDDAVRFSPDDVQAFKEACRVHRPMRQPSPKPRSQRFPAEWAGDSDVMETFRKLGLKPQLVPPSRRKG